MHWKDNHFCWEKNTMLPYKHSSVTEHVHFYISISCFWKNNSFFSCFFFCCKTDDIIFWWTLSTITLNIFFLTKLPHFLFCVWTRRKKYITYPGLLGVSDNDCCVPLSGSLHPATYQHIGYTCTVQYTKTNRLWTVLRTMNRIRPDSKYCAALASTEKWSSKQ